MNKLPDTVAVTDSLLAEDQAFKLTPVKGQYSDDGRVALTWRWPRTKEGHVSTVVTTATLNARKMLKLRVEEINGQFFLINEPTTTYDEEVRLCIENECVGAEIIQALIAFVSIKPDDTADAAELLGIPVWLDQFNKVAEHLMPVACFTFCSSLSLAALVWVLFV